MREKVTLGKIWGIIYPELLYTLITNIFVFFVTMVMTVLLMINGDYNSPDEIVKVLVGGINSQVMMITLWSAVVTLPFLIMFRRADIRHDKLNDRHVKYESVFPLKYLLIIPFGIFCMLAANSFVELLVMAVPGLMTDSYKAVEQSIYGSSFEIQVLAAGIICPIVEEMIYRALVYNRVKKLAGGVVAAVLSAVIFGVSHGNMIQGIYAFFIGLVCVYVYEK